MKPTQLLLTCLIGLAVPMAGLTQPTIQFATNTYTVAENFGVATLTVRRLNDTNGTVTVDYATANGTATNGLDYTATNGTLTFLAGETNQTIAVLILNDGAVESATFETFSVKLSNPANAVLGALTNTTVSIFDNDEGIEFQVDPYFVAEDAGSVLIGVVRGDDGNFPVTVNCATANGTAVSGVDYTRVTNTLPFAAFARGLEQKSPLGGSAG